jgi:predicted transcriptional regulator of viral defense system
VDDRAVAALAARQHGLVARRQLGDVTRKQVRHRLEAGRWHLVHPGVYAIGHRRRDPLARYMAAVLAAGPGAHLAQRSAAALWLLRPHQPGAVHVVTTRKLRPRADPIIHWTRDLPPHDRRRRDGIPVTSVDRTLEDLARTVTKEELALATQAAERLHGHRRATPHHSMTRGHLERRFLKALNGLNAPLPQLNVPYGPYILDALWPDHGIALEIDDWATHGTRAAFRQDRERDRALTAAGLRPARITADELEPAALRAVLTALGVL